MTLPIPTNLSQLTTYLRQGKRRLTIEVWRLWLQRKNDARPTNPPTLASLPPEPTVLFLCFGNICRSPMAERFLRNRLTEIGREGGTVRSAGFVEQDGRSSPDPAVTVAREYDVNLAEHGAKRVTREMVEDSDVVFVMDMWNYYDMKDAFADAMDRVYFLKPADENGGGFEIRDPHHSGVKRFETVYGTIADAIDRLVESR
ncbi:arsenate reductase/protein-tyrosine-phosphatase family protein [Halococcus hamelinensis]|uniref:Low molecular weight protein-tyrosine-phosphatase n=1 Tax=Halococcus hamelinensis 100A6 TaxID=1132509 RepID=M0LZR4_9EURY|nr:protein-tyrosine-phosphatase [Halococcus hamelinensis]EMA38663.1 low molecular weight protein-tyrosine-phosphatase [Halococcus hamelinensis 100A6]